MRKDYVRTHGIRTPDEVSGSHGVEYEDGRLLGCFAVKVDISLPIFQGDSP
jgi:hypothetical protein